MDAKRFFEVALPQMLINHLETFLVTRGTMAFSVQDAGEWTLCWGDLETPIAAGFRPDAETKVWLSASAWRAWSAGDLDPYAAVLSGEIVVDGNEAMLETLGYFLRPTNTLLDVYLQQG
jgi:putative sterol carrier protein